MSAKPRVTVAKKIWQKPPSFLEKTQTQSKHASLTHQENDLHLSPRGQILECVCSDCMALLFIFCPTRKWNSKWLLLIFLILYQLMIKIIAGCDCFGTETLLTRWCRLYWVKKLPVLTNFRRETAELVISHIQPNQMWQINEQMIRKTWHLIPFEIQILKSKNESNQYILQHQANTSVHTNVQQYTMYMYGGDMRTV